MGACGDGDGDDEPNPLKLIEAATQRVHDLEVELIELQKQYLARGTRDVLEEARAAVVKVSREVVEDLKKN